MDKVDNKNRGVASLLLILGILLVILAVIMGVYLVKQRTNLKSKANLAGVELSIQPSQATVTPRSNVQLTVFIDSSNYITSAVELHLIFDPSLVEVKTITPGTFLPVVLKPVQISNNEITVTLGASPGGAHKGSESLAIIELKTKQQFTGSTSILFGDQTKIAAFNYTSNVVGNKSSAILNTVTPPSTTIRPSSTSSPTPSPTNQYSLRQGNPSPTSNAIIQPTPPSSFSIISQRKAQPSPSTAARTSTRYLTPPTLKSTPTFTNSDNSIFTENPKPPSQDIPIIGGIVRFVSDIGSSINSLIQTLVNTANKLILGDNNK